jgi:hypothetical protein
MFGKMKLLEKLSVLLPFQFNFMNFNRGIFFAFFGWEKGGVPLPSP